MSKRITTLFMAALLGLSAVNAAWAEDAAPKKDDAPKNDSITGFGNLLGSDHFLSVGVQGGYGGYYLVVAPGLSIGGMAGVTFFNHLEVAFNYQYHSIAFLGVSLGSFNQIYGDILFRTATGSGFFIGASFGASTYSPPVSIPGTAPLFSSGFSYGGKLGYDVRITNFLSIGIAAQYFNPLLDGILSVKFWF